jgi:2-aminoadipate transaminase
MLTMAFTLAQRTAHMNPSAIREILKLADKPDVISLAGGLPAAEAFPVNAVRDATQRVLRHTPQQALQYAASEGYEPLREWVADHLLRTQGMVCTPDQVLITSGSQQGLDLMGKLLIDVGSEVLVQSPTYLGALQAFNAYEASFAPLDPPSAVARSAPTVAVGGSVGNPRMAYVQANFQNPSGAVLTLQERAAIVATAKRLQVPIVEDNPYAELWYDTPPPPSLASLWPQGVAYLGSFSKSLAPGLRLGYVVTPPALFGKLLQAKQACDLHTPIFNQRVVHDVLCQASFEQHGHALRTLYAARRNAMQDALAQHMSGLATWTKPSGGMFFWLTLAAPLDAFDTLDTLALLPTAVARGVAYVPGAPFFAQAPQHHTLRLSFTTVSPDKIHEGVALLAQVFRQAQHASPSKRQPTVPA